MKKILTIIVLLLNFSIAYCQQPFKQNLGNIANITFPDTPKIKDIQFVKLFYCKYNNLLYLAQATTLDSGLKDLLSNDKPDTVYDSFIQGELKSISGKLFYKNDIQINGLSGVEFGFTTTSNGGTAYNYNKVLYINDLLVSYSIRSIDSLKRDDQKITDFFNTFKLTVKNSDARQSGGEELGYQLGRFSAKLLILGIICSIGGLIIYIIKRMTNKNSK